MRILSVEKIVYTDYIVETDDQEFPTYRTNGSGYWENLMNGTWEETSNPVSSPRGISLRSFHPTCYRERTDMLNIAYAIEHSILMEIKTEIVHWTSDEPLGRWEIEQLVQNDRIRETGILDNDVAEYVLDHLADGVGLVQADSDFMCVRYIEEPTPEICERKRKTYYDSLDKSIILDLSMFYGVPFSLTYLMTGTSWAESFRFVQWCKRLNEQGERI
uniref:Uncharacterized protein n=1 Tax=Candidatus Kentrum sp. LFY TaxID=2126342 RepID=A0A450WI90_9GAMM|nr:MAG: hypothetical protein BECKLFY1418C_GA0070996_102550 [Candidatus Kentron sp. LFY]